MSSQPSEDSSGISMGELSRRLNEQVTKLESLAVRMESTYVRFDLFEASKQLSETERLQLASRLDKIESRSEWLVRTVGAIVIASLLGVIFAATKLKIGP